LLCACLSESPEAGRAAARQALGFYLALPAYYKIWEACGFEPADWQGEGSDRLIDALCAWGDRSRIEARIEEHLAAGADQVLIYPVATPGSGPVPLELFDALAPEHGQ
ncbi:MAG: LLM class F420-dependent oxidoreductase, partial [Myxococcales bacterium]|nr:LLM class F420-dependent oxidoreductase [Myxococcales bacterium]